MQMYNHANNIAVDHQKVIFAIYKQTLCRHAVN